MDLNHNNGQPLKGQPNKWRKYKSAKELDVPVSTNVQPYLVKYTERISRFPLD